MEVYDDDDGAFRPNRKNGRVFFREGGRIVSVACRVCVMMSDAVRHSRHQLAARFCTNTPTSFVASALISLLVVWCSLSHEFAVKPEPAAPPWQRRRPTPAAAQRATRRLQRFVIVLKEDLES
jgi:hypothetical protein